MFTASSRQPAAPSTTHPNTSGSQLTGRQASIRRSPRTKHFISQGFENRAFSETSNSTDMVESKVSYAIMSDTTVGGKSSIRANNIQRGELNGSVRRDRSAPDKGLSDDARSSVKFDLRSDSKMGKNNAPKSGKPRNVHSAALVPSKTMSVQRSRNKENEPQTVPKLSQDAAPKPKRSTTEGKNYFREYVNKGYDDEFNRSASLRKSKNRETSSSSHNSSNSYRHMNERLRDTRDVPDRARRSRSRSESRRESERYRESESDDYYREQQHRSRSVDRSRRRSESRSRRRDDYYVDWESDSDYHSRDDNRRSRSVERRSSRGPDRRPSSRHRTRDDYRDHYRSDDSFIRGSRRSDNRSGYKSDNRYDTRGSYRRDKRDGYRSDNRYDHREGYSNDNRYDREGYRSDNRYDHRDRMGSVRDRDRRTRTASRDRSDSYRSRTTSSSRYERN